MLLLVMRLVNLFSLQLVFVSGDVAFSGVSSSTFMTTGFSGILVLGLLLFSATVGTSKESGEDGLRSSTSFETSVVFCSVFIFVGRRCFVGEVDVFLIVTPIFPDSLERTSALRFAPRTSFGTMGWSSLLLVEASSASMMVSCGIIILGTGFNDGTFVEACELALGIVAENF